MNVKEIIIWIVLALAVGWVAYDQNGSRLTDDCQAYDRLGHGIGCEAPDLGDR